MQSGFPSRGGTDPGDGTGPVDGRMGLDPKGSELGRLVVATSAGSRLADRPDVVMVPGMAVSRYLRATRDLLADDTRVHLLELPGTGRAADLSRPMSTGLSQDAVAVTWWVRSFLPGPVALVGHSYGAQVVARVAAALPDQVVAVVLASPTVDPAFRSLPRLWARWLADTRKAPEGLASGPDRGAAPCRVAPPVRHGLVDGEGRPREVAARRARAGDRRTRPT